MSAVPITRRHVDRVLRFGLPTGRSGIIVHLRVGDPVPDAAKKTHWTLTLDTASHWGELLFAANRRNLHCVYPKDPPEQWGFPIDPYEFEVETALRPRLSPVAAIKACQGLAYQCSDHPQWKDSLAQRMLEAVKERAIRCLPGYDDAAWTL